MAKNKNTKQQRKQPKQQRRAAPRRRTQVRVRPYPSIGARIGDGLQKLGTSVINRIIGSGDYKMPDNMATIQKNCLFQDSNNQPPTFSSTGSSFVFEHSEYMGDIVSSSSAGGFKAQSFTVNPANNATFPWLSGLANNFETYEIEGMVFRFVSTSGIATGATNTQIGSVMGAFYYDTLDALPTTKSTLLQYEGCVDARTSENFLIGVECKRPANVLSNLYIGLPPTGSDPKTYNFGQLIVASNGLQSTNQTIGEIWCHYRIRCRITKQALDVDSSGHLQVGNNLVLNTTPFGIQSSQNINSGDVAMTVSGTNITFTGLEPGAKYLCSITYIGTGFSGAWSIGGLNWNSTTYAWNGFNNGFGASVYNLSAGSATYQQVVIPISGTATLTFPSTFTSSTLTSMDLYMVPLDGNTL
jgi:hypothetical protein